MSRIRSIHPGIFTDECFVAVSMTARVLIPGVWVEADDHGVFEWKPLTLKMKIFPADNVDMDALLAELLNADIIKKFSVDGKDYGAVRNFGRYQRPKKPSYKHPLPAELRTYVHATDKSSPPVENQSPTGTEKSFQREEEGGRKKEPEPKGSGAVAPPDPRSELFNRGLDSLASMTGKTPSSCRSLVGRWLKSCSDEAIHVLAAIDDAKTDRIVDPIPWIEARLRRRPAKSQAIPGII
jgi:hypothetical protein